MKIFRPRTLLIILLFLGLVLGGGYASYRGYKYARQTRLLKQARNFLATGKAKKAELCLARVLRSNNNNIEALRLLADLQETVYGSPNALVLRARVMELNPHSLNDRLSVAQTALSFRELSFATNTLEGVSPEGKKTPDFHNVAGIVAAAMNHIAEAEAHFLEASRLQPTNNSIQLSLAVVRLYQTNAPVLSQARSTLKQLSVDPALRCQALRELILDAARHQQTNDALALSVALIQQTNSAFADKMIRLEILRQIDDQSQEFKSFLAACQSHVTNELRVSEFGQWEMHKLGPTNLLKWLEILPANLKTNPPAIFLAADAIMRTNGWQALQTTLENQNWGPREFTRHAFRAYALRQLNMHDGAKVEWGRASSLAVNQKGTLFLLLRLSVGWKWITESEEILWTFVNRYPAEKWAARDLGEALYAGGRTRSLMTLFSQQAKAFPSDLNVKNNLAMTALLLNAQELKPHDLAREVYEKAPTNATFASTYAFSLSLQNKNFEALKCIEQLSQQQRQDPSIALYYGLILKATDKPDDAKIYLGLAKKTKLLPEEQKLMEKAL